MNPAPIKYPPRQEVQQLAAIVSAGLLQTGLFTTAHPKMYADNGLWKDSDSAEIVANMAAEVVNAIIISTDVLP